MADMNRSITIVSALGESFSFMKNNWRNLIDAIFICIIAQILIGAAELLKLDGFWRVILFFVSSFLTIVGITAMLRGSDDQNTGALNIRFKRDEMHVAISSIFVSLAPILLVAIVWASISSIVYMIYALSYGYGIAFTSFDIMRIVRIDPVFTIIIIILTAALFVAAIIVWSRLFLNRVTCVKEKRLSILDSWSSTKGHVLRIFVCNIAIWVPILLVRVLTSSIYVAHSAIFRNDSAALNVIILLIVAFTGAMCVFFNSGLQLYMYTHLRSSENAQ